MDGMPAMPASGDAGGGDQHERVVEELDASNGPSGSGSTPNVRSSAPGSDQVHQALVAVGLGQAGPRRRATPRAKRPMIAGSTRVPTLW